MSMDLKGKSFLKLLDLTPEEIGGLLDLAADTSPDFDLSNNTRAHLLSSFGLAEGKTALEKAKLNKQLYDALLNWGD